MEKRSKREKRKKSKRKFVDDGHTVYSMAGLDPDAEQRKKAGDIRLTRKERNAAIRAALGRYLPVLFLVIACFLIAGALIYLWLVH